MTPDGSHTIERLPRLHGIPAELRRAPLIAPHLGAGWVTDKIAALTEGPAPLWWKLALAASLCALAAGIVAAVQMVARGTGLMGVSHPAMWGWDVVNFVWWIGIAHAGTLISAILYLLRQRWRAAIHRVAEAMTVFAVLCAAVFPLIHVGRPWLDWWLLPIPTSNGVWPQFKSPLIWDVFAISTYFVVSLIFWYAGLVPDFALVRDRARSRVRQWIYGLLALGWTGSSRHWYHYEKAYLILAGLASALVVSVHSIVSLDFAASILPGWHSTMFPPFFVAGAIFSGLAMVLTLAIPLRRLLGLEELMTRRHMDALCKATLAAGLAVACAHVVEYSAAWFSGGDERFALFNNRLADPFILGPLLGVKAAPHWMAAWTMLACNVAAPQFLWFARIRSNLLAVFAIAVLINVGMWLERFLIIVPSLERDFLSSSWGHYAPTTVDILLFVGTFGLFFTLLLLFIRFAPVIAAAEVKGVAKWSAPTEADAGPPGPPTGRWLLAEFAFPAQALRAAEDVRKLGVANWDVYAPFPASGMSAAMGLRPPFLGWFAFAGSAAGFVGGMLAVWWMSAVDYPVLAGGKPAFSVWAGLPVAFELAILFGALGAVLGLLRATGLPQWGHPLFKSPRFALAGRDRFILAIDTEDPACAQQDLRAVMASHGSCRMEFAED